MDDPRYIILIALDTPSRETGMYISGGVMAAPTVGAVLEDILPYLQVSRSYAEDDPEGKQVQIPDLVGMSRKEAQALLESLSLEPLIQGEGTHITDQLPSPGTTVPGGSGMLLYTESQAPSDRVSVPDFRGMTLEQAVYLAAEQGLCLIASGNPDLTLPLQVLSQYPEPGTEAEPGAMIELKFTDRTVRD